MNIVILTSKDHIYGNYLLNMLIASGILDKDHVVVLEQSSLYPGKSKIVGLLKYIVNSGSKYTFHHIFRQLLFIRNRRIYRKNKVHNTLFFPYYINNMQNFKRKTMNGIAREENVLYLKSLKPDLILSLYSKEIIPKEIIEIPHLGCINLHPSFLPHYRGISPTIWCLSKNEKYTGATIHYVTNKIDGGGIISQAKCETRGFITDHSLYCKCTELGFKLLFEFLKKLKENCKNEIKAFEPDLSSGSYFSYPNRKAVKVFYKNGYRLFYFNEFRLKT